MKRLILLSALLFGSFCFSVATADEVAGKIISYGIFTLPSEHKSIEAVGTISGARTVFSGSPTLVVATNRIPAKIGVHFGFLYEITNLPVKDGEEVEIVKVLKYPLIKKPDGTTSNGHELALKRLVKDGRIVHYTGYGFDHDYELVPGIWEFEIKFDGKILCKQEFTVFQM